MRPILSFPFLNTVCAVLLSSACSLALAEDPPTRVGRISTVEGQVLVRAGDGEAQNALLNWPVTTDNRLSTMRGALAELRVGAAAVRLDGDSELEVSELDDDSFKLHLSYGTVSVRVRNPDALRGFELTTAQARVILTQPGWVRIEAGRQPGTSVVSVLDGAADVDGATGSVTLRAGKRAELTDEELRTGALQRIAFDNWPEALPAAAPALRYVTDDTTGYEELDRYGAWQDDAEYGPLWLPSTVPAGWAPYSDGRWTWIAPWGWTWVDNAPWGYAPSHYGRWVMLGQRWGWAPGRERGRVPWAPALVGWVGGNHGMNRGQRPDVGWFPLSPHDRYVPGYRASAEYERRLNRVAEGRRPVAGEREHRNRTIMPAPVLQSMPLSTPPAPAGNWQRPSDASRGDREFRRDWVNRPGRLQTDDGQTHLAPRPMQPNRPPVPAQPPQPQQPLIPAMPALPPVQDQVAHPAWRGEHRPRAERPFDAPRPDRAERGPRREVLQTAPLPAMPAPPPVAQPRPAAPPMPAPAARARNQERVNDRANDRANERGAPGRGGRMQELER
ncbi:DUF6600 domain-containing protein [Janthinobacterium sp. GMG1]|uniref:DUF6600 domain-containing protein n=1 Tax=Janthinobacterium sp. GMG1 TaxID=3096007 RepID=UPI002ACAA14B|nr:DUF6600 domain-containing protein [Janthinobacterium sp. GMG1]MDZ5636722.1 DUF6600 domain-containing protein [Janthinobacterium sp. GMG1]